MKPTTVYDTWVCLKLSEENTEMKQGSNMDDGWVEQDVYAMIMMIIVVRENPRVYIIYIYILYQFLYLYWVPSGNLNSYWTWPFTVDFPTKNCDFP